MSRREQYIEKINARFDQWDAEIARLKAKADAAEADAKIEYQKQLQELRAQRLLREGVHCEERGLRAAPRRPGRA